MLRVLLLAAAWKLMRKYVFHRRSRLDRQNLVRIMTEKLRALARLSPSRPAPAQNIDPASLEALSTATGHSVQPTPAPALLEEQPSFAAPDHPAPVSVVPGR
jgi:hypothetical protein